MPKNPQDNSSPLLFDILRNPHIESFLKDWAGETIFGRGIKYFQKNKVKAVNLARDGRLRGTVKGSEDYVCCIYLDENNNLTGDCSCPYDDICKHLVALCLHGHALLNKPSTPPIAGKADSRDAKQDSLVKAAPQAPHSALGYRLAKLSREKLVELLLKACEFDEEITLLCSAAVDSDGTEIQKLIIDTSTGIAKASTSPGFEKDPDQAYSEIAKQLRIISAAGKETETLELTRKVFDTCQGPISAHDYEGKIIDAVCKISEASLDALRTVDWSPATKLKWAVTARIWDEFGYTEPLEKYLREISDASIWAEVLEDLDRLYRENLHALHNSQLRSMRKMALEKAGKQDALLQFYEDEAQINHRYRELIDYLFKQGKDADAEKWIKKGLIEAESPYQAQELRKLLIEIRQKEGDREAIIILRTENFIESPDVSTYQACAEAAQEAGLWERLKPLLIQYLISGKLPWLDDSWSCKHKGSARLYKENFPLFRELIELAIHEKRPLDALRWHDRQRARGDFNAFPETALAEAIEAAAPERALTIWQREVERLIEQTNSQGYFEATKYIRKIMDLATEMGDEKRWVAWLISLRECHKRKKSFIKILENLEFCPRITY